MTDGPGSGWDEAMHAGFSLLSLMVLPILICQWLGVILLAKSGRSASWWHMLIGAALSSTALYQAAFPFLVHFFGTTSFTTLQTSILISAFSSSTGSLLFFIGFLLHALRVSKLRNRISELELLGLAQATELQRLRDP